MQHAKQSEDTWTSWKRGLVQVLERATAAQRVLLEAAVGLSRQWTVSPCCAVPKPFSCCMRA